jgi:alanine-glyoxylate transaminase/serine-glyoxylate transaminase/serine-pyruvate transaminase
LNDSNIEIGGGLGPLKGKIWRIGLMGSGRSRENVMMVLEAMHRAFEAEGHPCPSGLDAAERAYES